ncbi:MAG: hypothetical protein ACOZAR_01100 [Patescibacteria group bacterium]
MKSINERNVDSSLSTLEVLKKQFSEMMGTIGKLREENMGLKSMVEELKKRNSMLEKNIEEISLIANLRVSKNKNEK